MFSGRKKNKLFLKAARGAFRFASGSVRKDAYKIVTPSSTVGIRGTMFDMFIGGRGETIILLLHGRLQACSRAGNCRTLTNPCDAIRITRGGRISTGRGLTRSVLGGNRASRVAPFMYFQSQLLTSMTVGRGTVRQCVDVGDTDAPDPGEGGMGGSGREGGNGGGRENDHDEGDEGYIG